MGKIKDVVSATSISFGLMNSCKTFIKDFKKKTKKLDVERRKALYELCLNQFKEYQKKIK